MYRLLVLFAVVYGLESIAKPLNVLIDPGHGGSDTGAAIGEKRESEIVLNISNHLLELLSNDKNFITNMTRNSDRLVTLEERTNMADEKKADVLISIHANSAPSPTSRGTEIYFQNQLPPDVESLYLANRENAGAVQSASAKPKGDLASILYDLRHQNQIYLSSHLAKEVHKQWSRRQKSYLHIRQAPFHVLSEVKMPSVLIETGYLTNPIDRQKLIDPNYQKEVARIIYEGLQSYRQRWLSTL